MSRETEDSGRAGIGCGDWNMNLNNDHPLKRCIFSELQVQLEPEDIEHIDEICDQLYFDWLGHGINTFFYRATYDSIRSER